MTRPGKAAPGQMVRAAPALAAAAVAACHLGPDYARPQTATPDAWDNALASLPAKWPSPEWWKGFRSPQLDELIAEAGRGNTDLAAATARVEEADAQAQIAGAPLLPSLEAGTSIGPQRQYNLVGRERHHVLYQGLLSASYEIDFWGKNRAALEAAVAAANASRFARDVVWLTTATSVADLYFEFLGLRDRLQVARDNLARAQRSLGDVTLEERQGIVPHLAVVQQQAVVASLQTAIPPLDQALTTAKSALAVLVGKLPEDLHLRPGSLLDLARPKVVAGLPSELLARRPDIHEAEANLIAANANIRVARAAFFPSFNFPLSGGLTSLTLAQATVPPLGVYSLLSNVTLPIFEGGALRGRLEQSKASYQELLTGAYRKAVLAAFSDVENALSAVRTTAAEETAQQRSAEAAQQSSGLASQSLRGGMGTVLDLLLSESAVYSAQDGLVQARLAHLQSLIALTKALGGGWTL